MHDDPSPSVTAQVPDGNSSGTQRVGEPANSRARSDTAASRGRRSRRGKKSRKSKRRNPGLAKKLEHVTHLLKALDFVVYAELSSLYYMECSILRFLLRFVGQYVYLTPKHESFPFLLPPSRLHIYAVLAPNFLCMLLHILSELPKGPDYHRGYQHGAIIIDFVGQLPATYRLYYLFVDVFIMILQCLMLAVHAEREKLRVALETFKLIVPDDQRETMEEQTTEILDEVERGMRRDRNPGVPDEANDIELQTLRHQGDDAVEDGMAENADGASHRPGITDSHDSGTYLSDLMASGNAVIGEFHLVHTLKTAAWDLERSAARSLQAISYGATLAALRAGQRSTGISRNRA